MASIDVAMESTSQEILEKIGESLIGATKAVNIGYVTSSTPLNVTGRGSVRIYSTGTSSSYYGNVVITADGVKVFNANSSVIDSNGLGLYLEVDFQKSLSVTFEKDTSSVKYICSLY